jgi:oligosaccharide repeat unit polymerase
MAATSLYRSLTSGAVWVVGCRVVGIGATLASNILAARLLGPAEFGVFLLITTVIGLGSILGTGGLQEAGLRFISESLGLARDGLARAYLRHILRGAIWSSCAAALVVAMGLGAFQMVVAHSANALLLVALAAVGVIALSWQQIAAESLRGWNDLRLASLFSGGQGGGPLSSVLFVSGLAACAAAGMQLNAGTALALLVAAICVTLPLALAGLFRTSRLSDGAASAAGSALLNPVDRKLLYAAAGSLLLVQLLTFATYQLDVWIGGMLLSAGELGLFGAAKRCQLLAQMPVQMAMMTVISTIPRLHAQNNRTELERVVRSATTIAAIPSVIVLAVLALAPDRVLTAIFGDSYIGASTVVLPLVVGQLAHVLFGNPAYVLTMTGRQHLVIRMNIVSTVVLVASGIVGSLVAGPVGLAIGSAAAMTLQNGVLWWLTHRELGIWTNVGWPAFSLTSGSRPALSEPLPPLRPASSLPSISLVRKLWWLHPAWPFAGVVGVTILAAWLQDDQAYRLYGTPKYLSFEHVLMAFGAIAVFVLGCRLADATGSAPAATPESSHRLVRQWFYVTTFLAILGYVVWFAVGFKNGFSPRLLLDLLLHDDFDAYDQIRHSYFRTIPGITTCTQFAAAATLLGCWVYVHGDKRAFWPLAALMGLGLIRALLFSERTALIELLLPVLLVALRRYVLGRSWGPRMRLALVAGPVAGLVGIVLFFGVFEYFRSWRWYQDQFDSVAEFTLWRLSGYFTTAHNNGAMALVLDVPRPLPYSTLTPFWEFPGIKDSPLDYYHLSGVEIHQQTETMLERYGTIELNNDGGLFQPALDFGLVGYLVFWFGYGFAAARLYRGFLGGTVPGLTLYPLVYMSILEVPLILFLFYTRTVPSLAALLAVALLTSWPRPAAVSVAVPHLGPNVSEA